MEHGASFFAVATLDEAIELRMHGIDAKILVLGVIPYAFNLVLFGILFYL